MVRNFAVPITISVIILISIYLFDDFFHEKNHQIEQADASENILDEENLEISTAYNADSISPITLDEIFNNKKLDMNNLDTWDLVVTGDVMLGRTVNFKTIQSKDYKWPFLNIAENLKSGDLTFINLENPFYENCPTKNEGMIFCSPINNIEGLKFAGVDLASISNNHALNYGLDGFDYTKKQLISNSILPVTNEGPVYKEVNGLKVAFIAFNDVECSLVKIQEFCVDDALLENYIHEAKSNFSDLIVIMFHWGNEYKDYPTVRQTDLAYKSIDLGADLVLGNHPHWIQGVEIYKDKLIAYSHGNLIFDQMWSDKTRKGVIGHYIFYKKHLVDVQFDPILIENYGQPRILSENERGQILDHMQNISIDIIK